MADRRRIERVNGLLRDEISALVAARIKDPRLRAVVSVTQVQTAADLRTARVYISVMGSDAVRQEALAGIRSSASYLRRELRSRVSLRYVPFLNFMLDDAMLEADRLMRLIDDLTYADAEAGDDTPAPASAPGPTGRA